MLIKVGVFTHYSANKKRRLPRVHAYTIWFNPSWEGCCMHEVDACNGTEAKKIAIADHKARCLKEAQVG